MKSRWIAVLISAAIVAVFLAGSVAAPRPALAQEKIRFLLNWIPYGLHTGFYTALERGYYKEAGFDITIDRGYGSSDTAKKIGGGVGDFGFSGFPAVTLGRARDVKIKLLGVILDRGTHAIFALKGKGITKPSDLVGRTIGAPTASVLRVSFPALAKANNFNPSAVKWVNMPGSALVPALISEKVDSVATFATIQHKIEARAKAAGKEAITILYSEHGVDLYSVGLIATDQRIENNPKQVRRFVEASMKGVAWAVENPEQGVADLIKTHSALNAKLERTTWRIVTDHMLTPYQRTHGLGQISRAKAQRTRDIVLEGHKIKKDIPVEDLYTNRFLPKLFPRRIAW
ncbi:MAG: ABC transporter substrate-binding protein [Nitrospinota bacterium]